MERKVVNVCPPEDYKIINIIPPKGYVIDKENSTFECIKFKPMEKWRDGNPIIKGWYVGNNIVIPYNLNGTFKHRWKNDNLNVFATEKQAKSALAMAQISQIMANDKRFGGVITDEEWNNSDIKHAIERHNNKLSYTDVYKRYYFLAFHTFEQRDLFIRENEDLVKEYLMID